MLSRNKTVIVQMFEWTWDSIAAECTEFLGPAGYGYVQASPAQEHVQGPEWWTDYQPVSYTLTSKRGNRDQYANMINTCHSAGVKIIADTIMNHMSKVESGSGVGGSSFTHYDYPGTYQSQDFHHCGLQPDDNIVDYSNRLEVQTCQLDGLADLATETEYVRSRLAGYANDLLSLGVDGLRLDAAKHIAAVDLANITSRLHGSPYLSQEVIYGAGEPISPNEYVDIGAVQDIFRFRYTSTLQSAFLEGGISSLKDLDSLGWIPGDRANVFVANHDTERNGASLNENSPSNTYVTATIFSLAHPYGTPTLLSSYSGFEDSDAGAPNGGTGTCAGTGGTNGWFCQHRWIAFSGMVGFRNAVGSAPLTDWVSPQPQLIAFGRGSLGFVAINNIDSPWSATFQTSLSDGPYCDVVSGSSFNGQCSAASFNVTGGAFTAIVPARSAVAIHAGSTGQGSGSNDVVVNFKVAASTTYGENIFIVGSVARLGSWDPAAALPLFPTSYPNWTIPVPFAPNASIEYKFIRKEIDGSIIWECDPNRKVKAPTSGSTNVITTWR
ncbi:hypothetical protein EIP91_005684 [Steccherinum ochraceum]|uniref:Alpha-amylase n=1 Tax=Steccherinum ochraceum TaxID=92696 RepID=A0A4R0R9L4_9APHY|nr:hypothetical protein EIP91_005684 [Steccherinum ochraceum]